MVALAESGEDVGSFELHPVAHVQNECLLLQVSKPDPRSGAELACTTTVRRVAPLAQHLCPCVFHHHFRLLGVLATCSCGVWRTRSCLSSQLKQVRQCELILVTILFSLKSHKVFCCFWAWELGLPPSFICPQTTENPLDLPFTYTVF
jgi:hypothetical protein